jgi:hypothetical protein
MWLGCDFFAWIRLLVRNRFAVDWRHLHIAIIDTLTSMIVTLLGGLQRLVYGRQVAHTPIQQAPVFILGHWRTGTTFLHELLILDERHNFPTTYQCMAPSHFLLTEGILTRLLYFLMPERRPMDNMAAGWDRPQEDEFALCMLGQPSPYLTIAFPNRPPQFPEYLDLEGLTPRALESWKRTLFRFLQALTYKDPKRLVLKSPPHTCRLRALVQLFPDARFIHLVRDPHVVFPSTVNLWKSLYRAQGLQQPTFAGLEEQVFATFLRFQQRLAEGRKLIAPERFYELRYEELVRDPVSEVRALYEHLDLGGFEELLPRLEKYVAGLKGYETNRYELSPQRRAEVARRWGSYIRQYGYESSRPAAANDGSYSGG